MNYTYSLLTRSMTSVEVAAFYGSHRYSLVNLSDRISQGIWRKVLNSRDELSACNL